IVNKEKNLQSRVTLEIFNIPRYWALTPKSSDFGDFQYTSLLGAYASSQSCTKILQDNAYNS
ncbi:hypothetical protein, partial [Enterococcus cecorum]|uniref:hypothetical protein n=1 Tax=Enterococcus cecorum TaxID=44008 RepID=UPI001AEC4A16